MLRSDIRVGVELLFRVLETDGINSGLDHLDNQKPHLSISVDYYVI